MDNCYAKLKSSNKWMLVTEKQVESGDVNINDISEIVCPYCRATGFYKSKGDKRIKHFAFVHKEDCPFIKESKAKHKVKTIYTGDIVLEDDMLYKNVNRIRPPKIEPNIDKGPEINQSGKSQSPDEIEIKNFLTVGSDEYIDDIDYGIQGTETKPIIPCLIDDIDMIAKYKDKIICRPIGLYKLIQKIGVYEPILPDGRTGDDILLDEIHLQKIRRTGFDNEKKLVICKRAGTKILEHPFNIPKGYTLLRDIYAKDIENSIFYLVKITHEKYNEDFKKQLMGEKGNREKTRNQCKDLLIYHIWKRYPNDFYQIYIADISSSSYSFVNMTYDNIRKTK